MLPVLKGISHVLHMNKTKTIIGAVVIAGVFFYGGYAFAGGGAAKGRIAYAGTAGFSRTAGVGGMMGGRNAGGGILAGNVISADAQSITVGSQGAGSKIVFIGGSTQIMKSVSGTAQDIAVGQSVMITGTANSDGSLTAQSVQIRPARPATTTSAQ